MKKAVSLILALMVILSLVACGSQKSTEQKTQTTEKTEVTETAKAEEKTADTPVVLKLSEQNSESSINATFWKKVAPFGDYDSAAILIIVKSGGIQIVRRA